MAKSVRNRANLVGNAAAVKRKKQGAQMTWNEATYELTESVQNLLLSRASLMRRMMDPRRNVNQECGYPETGELDFEAFNNLYEREPIAARVVEVLPKETWKSTPTVYEDEDADVETEFEKAWDELGKSLRGQSWYKQEKSNPIWEYLRRVDILSGIGHYGVLLLGLDDGADLSDPVPGINPTTGEREGAGPSDLTLKYLRAFPEGSAEITRFETDKTSPRYGQPVEYNLTLNDPNAPSLGVGVGIENNTVKVHWTRVIHIADNRGSSEIWGTPRQRPVYNRLYDLVKLYGGSAEMYWRAGVPGLVIESHPNLGGEDDIEIDETQLKSDVYNFQNSLQKALILLGTQAKYLAPEVADPSLQIDSQITAICIVIGMPKRVFMGSERGELASGQDDDTWNERIEERQSGYVTPLIIIPFVDRLILLGVLPEPESYYVEWPALDTLNEMEQADLAARLTEAIVKFVSGGGDQLFDPLDWLTRILGMDEEEAQEVIDNVMKHLEAANPDNAEQDIVPGRNPPPPIELGADGLPIPQGKIPTKGNGKVPPKPPKRAPAAR